jgi:hypothetical protein
MSNNCRYQSQLFTLLFSFTWNPPFLFLFLEKDTHARLLPNLRTQQIRDDHIEDHLEVFTVEKTRNQSLNLLLYLNHHTASLPDSGLCPCCLSLLFSFARLFSDSGRCPSLESLWAKCWFLLDLHLRYSTSSEFVLMAIPNPVNDESRTARTELTLNYTSYNTI